MLIGQDGNGFVVLLAQRPTVKPHAGRWEFPGGKVNPGESLMQALIREMYEEIKVLVKEKDMVLIEDTSPPATTAQGIRLSLFLVQRWKGTPIGQEQQQVQWVSSWLLPLWAPTMPNLDRAQLPDVLLAINSSNASTTTAKKAKFTINKW